jgi:CARDB
MLRTLPIALAAALVLPASASAATVSGTVGGGQGYTVIALSATGQSSKATVGAGGRFKLKLPGKGTTLQLVKPDGTYFGPVVLRTAGKRAFVGLSANGGKLGRISLKRGFASAKAPKAAVTADAIRTAKGAPLGAGKLGFVKVTKSGAHAAAAAKKSQPGGDPDGDGVPNTFDADDNGNKTLDGVDPVTAKTDTAGLFSDVQVMMARSVNANAAGITGAQVDEFVKNNTSLNFYLDPSYARGAAISAVDVDCGALRYCRTATLGDGGNSPTGVQDQLWTTLDTNHDGFPDVPANGAIHSIEIKPNATTADLHAGDLYQLRFSTPGAVLTVPTALSFYFTSAPALASYDGGAGTVNIAYPATDSTAGSDGNPLRMTGDSITLRFWRPQRAGLGSEPDYMDMGHLHYGVPISVGSRQLDCGANRFSGLSPTLSATADRFFPLRDSAADAAPNAGNLLKVTLDLGGCLRADGIDPSGQQIRLPLQAVTESRPGGSDRTAQTLAVCLSGCVPAPTGGPTGPSSKPDLVVDSALSSDVGDHCDIAIQVSNPGTAQSFPTDTRIALAGSPEFVIPTQSIAAGGTQTASTSIPGSCLGRAFTITADSANSVDELVETNNVVSGVF